MALPGAEVRERHLVGAADFGLEMMDLAGKPVWRKPFGHCVSVQERTIDFLRSRVEHAVKPDSVGWHSFRSFSDYWIFEILAGNIAQLRFRSKLDRRNITDVLRSPREAGGHQSHCLRRGIGPGCFDPVPS